MNHGDFAPDFTAIPDPASPQYAHAVGEWLAGTYDTGWSVLKDATFSSAMAALRTTMDVYKLCDSIRANETHPGIRSFLLDTNYLTSMLGPCLGSVALTAFSIESFVRLGFSLALELNARRPRSKRGAGLDEVMQARLAEFDGSNAIPRLKLMWTSARVPHQAALIDQLAHLAAFRNSLAHDLPGIIRQNLEVEVHNRNRGVAKRANAFGPYSALTVTERPVRLKHVIASIRAHDSLVSHSLENSHLKGWRDAVSSVDVASRGALISRIAPGANWWSKLREMSKLWEGGPQKDMQASPEEHFDARAILVRRVSMKLEV